MYRGMMDGQTDGWMTDGRVGGGMDWWVGEQMGRWECLHLSLVGAPLHGSGGRGPSRPAWKAPHLMWLPPSDGCGTMV